MSILSKYFEGQPRWLLAEHAAVTVLGLFAMKHAWANFSLDALISAVPGAKALVNKELEKEVDKAVAEMFPVIEGQPAPVVSIPARKTPKADMLSLLSTLKKVDDKVLGRTFAYVYLTDGDHHAVIEEAFTMFMHENALNPAAFPSLRRMEVEVVQMTASMLNAPEGAAGNMTSGGTESILCAVKAMRDYAREKKPHASKNPNMIVSTTVHPAFEKAAHYFGVEIRHVACCEDDKTSDIDGYRRAIDSNTILLVVSAPQYPHGIIDKVEAASDLALEFDIPLHVDACIGGFVLPWIEKLGYAVPKWDFRVPGVTSMSADIHKYGYAPKGASVVLFRTREMRQKMTFAYSQWPGGLFVSPSLLGTRGGGGIAGAWASMVHLGEEGFMELARKLMDAKEHMWTVINETDGLEVVGNPNSSLISFRSTDPKVNIHAVADVMESVYGWKIDRQRLPDTLHMTMMPVHWTQRVKIGQDLVASVAEVRSDPEKYNSQGSAAIYGNAAKIPSDSILDEFLVKFMDKVFTA